MSTIRKTTIAAAAILTALAVAFMIASLWTAGRDLSTELGVTGLILGGAAFVAVMAVVS